MLGHALMGGCSQCLHRSAVLRLCEVAHPIEHTLKLAVSFLGEAGTHLAAAMHAPWMWMAAPRLTKMHCVQIGQIMLTMPNAMAKMGLIAALPLAVVIACMSLWSMKMLICLYVARRSILVSTNLSIENLKTVCLHYVADLCSHSVSGVEGTPQPALVTFAAPQAAVSDMSQRRARLPRKDARHCTCRLSKISGLARMALAQ